MLTNLITNILHCLNTTDFVHNSKMRLEVAVKTQVQILNGGYFGVDSILFFRFYMLTNDSLTFID